MTWRLCLLLLVAVLGASELASAAPPTLAGFCQVPGLKGTVITFSGTTKAAVIGTGNVGVVLANTSDGKLCDWPLNESNLMKGLSKSGYRVMLFNYRGTTEAAQARDDAAAAALLRKVGSSTIVLGGGSIGGVVSIEAATMMKPAPAAVFGLSASSDSDSAATAAARKLRVPLLLVAARQDPYASSTKAIYRASASKPKQLLLVPGMTHAFFDLDSSDRKIDATVLGFIAAHS